MKGVPTGLSFYFARHGETDWNLQNRFQGQRDIPLNQVGRAQAEGMVEVLAALNIEVLICSHLSRASETAQIFAAKVAPRPQILVYRDLSECESEVTAKLIYNGLGRQTYPCFKEVATSDETPGQFRRRVESAVTEIFSGLSGRRFLIVAHGGTYWAICEFLKVKAGDIPNCRPIRFTKTDSGWIQEIIWNADSDTADSNTQNTRCATSSDQYGCAPGKVKHVPATETVNHALNSPPQSAS